MSFVKKALVKKNFLLSSEREIIEVVTIEKTNKPVTPPQAILAIPPLM